MVLQAVEVSRIMKCSKSFIPVISPTCCAVKFDCCKMILFTFKFPLFKFFSCWSSNGLESNLNSYQVMSLDHCKMFPSSRRSYHSLTP